MLYGANEYTISKVMQTEIKTVRKIKKELGINDLNDRLEQEFNKKGFILNYYGSPITSNNNLVNYWIQSSAVDFCSLTFYEFLKDLKVNPSFFVHDSLTFQIDKTRVSEILNIKDLSESRSNISVPIEISILSE